MVIGKIDLNLLWYAFLYHVSFNSLSFDVIKSLLGYHYRRG